MTRFALADHGQDLSFQPNPLWSTARLELRRPRADDVVDVFAYASDPVVTRFTDWPAVSDLHQVAEVIAGWQRDWDSGAEFTWVVTMRQIDRTIGSVSCSLTGADVTFGYVLNRAHWGNGYATELSSALVKRLLAEPGVQLIRATCDEENVASRRVLEKVGLNYRGRAPRDISRPQISQLPRPACLYERLRIE